LGRIPLVELPHARAERFHDFVPRDGGCKCLSINKVDQFIALDRKNLAIGKCH
jgi:hypothetical protein